MKSVDGGVNVCELELSSFARLRPLAPAALCLVVGATHAFPTPAPHDTTKSLLTLAAETFSKWSRKRLLYHHRIILVYSKTAFDRDLY